MKSFIFVLMFSLFAATSFAQIQCIPGEGEPPFPSGVILCVDDLCSAVATYSSETIPYGWRITFVDRQYIGLHFQHEDIDWDSLVWLEINWEGGDSKRSPIIDLTSYIDVCDQVVDTYETSFGTVKSIYR